MAVPGELLLREAIMLKGVLFAPNLKCNLLSVHRLTKDLHCAITFFPDFFVIQGLESRSLIGVGRCSGGLYRLKGIKDERKAMVVTADIWHKRLETSLLILKIRLVILVLRQSLPDYLFQLVQ
uniref:Uncharacterized protein n=1 Tax=Lactuca sativa TaxID=4236 RepID=A0A9R1X753_LACSA|nr:hypothetical protein LSAT_V11C600320120 [Lactuca sativa]